MAIDAIPVWVVFAGTVLFILAAIEAGYRLGLFARRQPEEEKAAPGEVIARTILGLVSFLLAFTFGIVTNRHDARKELVRQEANAIRTAWDRSDLLPELDRIQAKRLLRSYSVFQVTSAQRLKEELCGALNSWDLNPYLRTCSMKSLWVYARGKDLSLSCQNPVTS